MLKMIDVLEQSLVQNFTHAVATSAHSHLLDEQLHQSILNASEADLKRAMQHFFQREDALETAQALEISTDTFVALQQGSALQGEHLTATKKIAALCLALETNTLEQLDIAQCLQDYPM